MFSGTSKRGSSAGMLYAIELLIALPLLMLVAMALLEFCLLWSANLKVKEASRAAARVAALPAAGTAELNEVVTDAAIEALGSARLADELRLRVDPGYHTGDPVLVEIKVPMKAASPDLLDFFGFSLRDRVLVGQTVMRKE